MFNQNELVLVVNRGIKGLFGPTMTEDFVRQDGELPILERTSNPDLVVGALNPPLKFNTPDTVHDWDGIGEVALLFEGGDCRLATYEKEMGFVSSYGYWEETRGEPLSSEEDEAARRASVLGMGTILGWLPVEEAAEQLLSLGDKLEKEMAPFSLYKKGGFAVSVCK